MNIQLGKNNLIDLKILSYLTVQDIINIGRVNKYFNFLCSTNKLWKHKVRECFGKNQKQQDESWKTFYIRRLQVKHIWGPTIWKVIHNLENKNEFNLQ